MAETRIAAVLAQLHALADPSRLAGMARVGIRTDAALGVSVPQLRQIAKSLGRDHGLAEALWESGIHEARILAGLVGDPAKVTEEQMERWAAQFDSWDVVDLCSDLLGHSAFGYAKAFQWAGREEEFVKRAGFVLMAERAVHDKRALDERLLKFLPVIERESDDDRNYVRKAVNWALRQIGKRSPMLNAAAIETAERILGRGTRAARWIATDALRELQGAEVQRRLAKRAGP
jgi:3-methyladenine DNA glycosylase AlkD